MFAYQFPAVTPTSMMPKTMRPTVQSSMAFLDSTAFVCARADLYGNPENLTVRYIQSRIHTIGTTKFAADTKMNIHRRASTAALEIKRRNSVS